MTYSDCKVLSVLQHKEEPLISKIPCDEYTQLAQSYFDYEFFENFAELKVGRSCKILENGYIKVSDSMFDKINGKYKIVTNF